MIGEAVLVIWRGLSIAWLGALSFIMTVDVLLLGNLEMAWRELLSFLAFAYCFAPEFPMPKGIGVRGEIKQ